MIILLHVVFIKIPIQRWSQKQQEAQKCDTNDTTSDTVGFGEIKMF